MTAFFDTNLTEVNGKKYKMIKGIPCFLDSMDLVPSQSRELASTVAYINGIKAGRNELYDQIRFYDQPKVCWEWAERWINDNTVNDDTKIVCVGGSFADDLPHVKSDYKFNIDHLACHYMRTAPDMKDANTHYIACKSEALPFGDGYADIVYTRNALDHVDNPVKTLLEMHRIVSQSGRVFIGVYFNSTFLSDHESMVINDEFLTKCIEPLFTIEHRSMDEAPQQHLAVGKTGFIYLVCKKKEGGKVRLTEEQIDNIEKILYYFHLGFIHQGKDTQLAVKYYKKLLEIQPVLDTDKLRMDQARGFLGAHKESL